MDNNINSFTGKPRDESANPSTAERRVDDTNDYKARFLKLESRVNHIFSKYHFGDLQEHDVEFDRKQKTGA